ncbi:hypothetical protein FA95DRAFT_211871 [Auriscalpium vulgare]|uniref:Uncharacterized protein n=1 Tax=Auriscalpium vulgare TaxID=40419 RepID=A0ACB8RKY7_9AGAM|nr:hypothetical protein FA95DRAFT_211871 [Auriscalpium vulgare]
MSSTFPSLQPLADNLPVDACTTIPPRSSTSSPALSPVTRLPPEILCDVLHWCRSVWPPSKYPVLNDDGLVLRHSLDIGWINMTHVCRQWRTVALNDPTLWSHIIVQTHGSRWLEEMFARSRSAALIVDGKHNEAPALAALIIKHLPHTAELHIDSKLIVNGLCVPAPLLQRISLTEHSEHARAGIPLPPDFLGNHAPRLQHLFIANALNFPWTVHSLLRNLRTLDLTYYGRSTEPPTLGVLLDALDAMPALQALTLGGCLPAPAPPTPREVPLPRLAYLRLSADIDELTSLLMHLKAPVSAQLNIQTTWLRDADEARTFFPVLAAYLYSGGGPADRPIYSISSYARLRSLGMLLWFKDGAQSVLGRRYGHVSLAFSVEGPEVSAELARAVCEMLAAEPPEYLDLQERWTWTLGD